MSKRSIFRYKDFHSEKKGEFPQNLRTARISINTQVASVFATVSFALIILIIGFSPDITKPISIITVVLLLTGGIGFVFCLDASSSMASIRWNKRGLRNISKKTWTFYFLGMYLTGSALLIFVSVISWALTLLGIGVYLLFMWYYAFVK